MADDLNKKLRAELDEMKAEIRRLQRANPLEAASVTSGRVRFIGGQLLIDAGGNLLVNGTLAVNGTSTVTGSFTVSGPWNLSGTGTISGNVTITGNVTSTGTLTQNGPWNMNGLGTIAGDVNQTGVYRVKPGGRIIIEGADGDLVLSDSKQTFANGAEVRAPGSGGIRFTYGTTNIFLDGSSAIVTSGTRRIIVTSTGFQFFNVPTKTAVSTGLTAGAAHLDPSGNLFRIT